MATFLGLRRTNFFRFWIILELRIISFVLILLLNKRILKDSAIKYFIVQAISSRILLFSLLGISLRRLRIFIFIFSIALILKLGRAPFHAWFINIARELEWRELFLILTLQKFLPLSLIIIFTNSDLFLLFIILNIFISLKLVFSETFLKKILTLSSIYRIRWLFATRRYFPVILFLRIYSLNLFFLVFFLNKLNFVLLDEKSNLNSHKRVLSIIIIFLRLGGLPPLVGFYPKFVILAVLITQKKMFLSFVLTQRTVIFLFFYLKMFLSLGFMKNKALPWRKRVYISNSVLMCLFLRRALIFIVLHKDV